MKRSSVASQFSAPLANFKGLHLKARELPVRLLLSSYSTYEYVHVLFPFPWLSGCVYVAYTYILRLDRTDVADADTYCWPFPSPISASLNRPSILLSWQDQFDS